MDYLKRIGITPNNKRERKMLGPFMKAIGYTWNGYRWTSVEIYSEAEKASIDKFLTELQSVSKYDLMPGYELKKLEDLEYTPISGALIPDSKQVYYEGARVDLEIGDAMQLVGKSRKIILNITELWLLRLIRGLKSEPKTRLIYDGRQFSAVKHKVKFKSKLSETITRYIIARYQPKHGDILGFEFCNDRFVFIAGKHRKFQKFESSPIEICKNLPFNYLFGVLEYGFKLSEFKVMGESLVTSNEWIAGEIWKIIGSHVYPHMLRLVAFHIGNTACFAVICDSGSINSDTEWRFVPGFDNVFIDNSLL